MLDKCSVLLLTHDIAEGISQVVSVETTVNNLVKCFHRFSFQLWKTSKVVLFINIFIVMNNYLSLFIGFFKSNPAKQSALFVWRCLATGQYDWHPIFQGVEETCSVSLNSVRRIDTVAALEVQPAIVPFPFRLQHNDDASLMLIIGCYI